MDDTIVALATAMGEAGIHVLRISGNDAKKIINKIFIPRNLKRWNNEENYTLHLGWLGDKDKPIDEVLIARMSAPHSFTGEDVYEIHCHGGPWVAQRILEFCVNSGARMAEAGEFTKRAFLNGKLDLVQAEAIIDLISARTDFSANLALNQLKGGLSEKVLILKDGILEILAFIEAGIDFPEDEVDELEKDHLKSKVNENIEKAKILLEGSKIGKILREGLITVIVGRPNVGKSSLLNALLQEDRAIVTDIPGTTRDEIREFVNIGGILLQLVDTAGIRKSEDIVEKIGIERSWNAMKNSDLILLVVDSRIPFSDEEKTIIKQYSEKIIVLCNKIDLADERDEVEWNIDDVVMLPFSVVEHIGFDALENEIKSRVFQGNIKLSSEPLLSNVRQISALKNCHQSLLNALEGINNDMPMDIVSIDVRQAVQDISEITGDNVQESLLDTIFSRFCIGK